MAYKLRFVQTFEKSNTDEFLSLEKAFIELEKNDLTMACGKRYTPLLGREPTNCMIWEAEFERLEDAIQNLKNIESSNFHDQLLKQQIAYMRDAYVEIYQKL